MTNRPAAGSSGQPQGEAAAPNVQSIAEVLESQGFYMGPPVGVSMKPMLRNRTDVIVVRPLERPLERYDVALYRRGTAYVLHRIVGFYRDGYVICGDNCQNLEYIPGEHVIGVLEGFYRNGVFVDCRKNACYRVYSRTWVALYPVRKGAMRVNAGARSAARRVLGKMGLWPRKTAGAATESVSGEASGAASPRKER